MNTDIINGLFEGVGACVLMMNVRQLLHDKVICGVHIFPTIFYTLWGLWNLFYYPSLNQWFSFSGGVAIVIVNAAWVALAIHYK